MITEPSYRVDYTTADADHSVITVPIIRPNREKLQRGCRVRQPRLRGQDVLVNDTAETITAQNPTGTGCRHNCSRLPWLRRRERQRSMEPVLVVAIDEHLEDPLKVLLLQN